MHVSTGGCGGQERVTDPLELELQAVGSHSAWVLGADCPLQKRYAFLTAEPSLQPPPCILTPLRLYQV